MKSLGPLIILSGTLFLQGISETIAPHHLILEKFFALPPPTPSSEPDRLNGGTDYRSHNLCSFPVNRKSASQHNGSVCTGRGSFHVSHIARDSLQAGGTDKPTGEDVEMCGPERSDVYLHRYVR